MVATDGQKLTLGDTTLTLYITPGHTLGHALDADSGEGSAACRTWPHAGAARRSTGLANRTAYITPERPDSFWFETYSDSARRFKEIAAKAGADVIIVEPHRSSTAPRPSFRPIL